MSRCSNIKDHLYYNTTDRRDYKDRCRPQKPLCFPRNTLSSWTFAQQQARNLVIKVALSVMVGLATGTASAQSGLVAAYGFDEGSDTTVNDSSGNGNTGTLINGPIWTSGQFGQALEFNNTSDHVLVPTNSSLGITGDITISAWIRLGNPSFAYQGILSKFQNGAGWDYVLSYNDNGSNNLFLYSDGMSPNFVRSTTPLIDTTTFHHVAVTRSANAVTFYIDGIQAGTATVTGTFPNNSNPVVIGSETGSGGEFRGRIDEVRIYSRALSQSEIQTDMSTPIGDLAASP